MKICEWCSVEFETTDAQRKFCSQSCSAKKSNTGRFRVERKYCLNCNQQIISYKPANYCSQACRQTFSLQKRIKDSENGIKKASHITYRKYLIMTQGSKCVKCGWDKINPTTKKVPIELNHKDGNSMNTILSNLELLCPNCHSLTPNYGSLNKGKGRPFRMKRYNAGKSY